MIRTPGLKWYTLPVAFITQLLVTGVPKTCPGLNLRRTFPAMPNMLFPLPPVMLRFYRNALGPRWNLVPSALPTVAISAPPLLPLLPRALLAHPRGRQGLGKIQLKTAVGLGLGVVTVPWPVASRLPPVRVLTRPSLLLAKWPQWSSTWWNPRSGLVVPMQVSLPLL